jgi:hypothetical protein
MEGFWIHDCPDCDAGAKARAMRKRWARTDPRRRRDCDYFLAS